MQYYCPKNSQAGFAQILILVLLLVGLAAGVYLVQQQTNFFPKASTLQSVSRPITPKQEYTLVPSTSSTVYLTDSSSNPKTGYHATLTLKDKKEAVVADQSGMTYTWTASNANVVKVAPSSYCASGVNTPCPQAAADLSGGTPGTAIVTAVVTRNKKTLAQTTFNVVVKATPTPTPIPTTGIKVDKNTVEVTLDKVNAQYGLIYGTGFKITSIDANGWQIKYNEPTSGQGFYESSGGIVPGGIATIRSYINSSKAVGTYTGSATVMYSKNNVWYNGPSVVYKITLIDSSVLPTLTLTPTPIPNISFTGVGAFDLNIYNYSKPFDGQLSIDQSGRMFTLTCSQSMVNCFLSAQISNKNRTAYPLSNTTVWVDNPLINGTRSNILQYYFEGQVVSTKNVFLGTIQPGESSFTTAFIARSPQIPGTYFTYFNTDAQRCNNAVTPPDCIFYGGSSFTIKLVIIP